MNLAGTVYQTRIKPDIPLAELKDILTGPDVAKIATQMYFKLFESHIANEGAAPKSVNTAMTELAACGLTADSITIEYSSSYCDWYILSNSGKVAGIQFPPIQKRFSLYHPLRRSLPGLPTHSLPYLHPLFFTDELSKDHHRALLDTAKLGNILAKYVAMVKDQLPVRIRTQHSSTLSTVESAALQCATKAME